MPELAIQMRQISKSYDGFFANQKIDFRLQKGTIHALAGENGAGKSTLMKILFGLEHPDPSPNSEILVNGVQAKFKNPQDAISSGIGMVQQHFALSGALTSLENIILGCEPKKGSFIDHKGALERIRSLAGDELKVPWNHLTEDLAVGDQQRLEILKLLFRKSEILILDEPTGVLAPNEVGRFFELLRRLKNSGKSIVIITHKLDEIFSLCDEVSVLRQGKLAGNFKISEISKSTLVEAMIGRQLEKKPKTKNKSKNSINSPVIIAKNLTLKKEGRGSIHNLEFEIRPGEILGVAGVEGNGQQALVSAIFGWDESVGEIIFNGKCVIPRNCNLRRDYNFALISEDSQKQSLWLDADIRENCVLGLTGAFTRFGILNEKKMTEFAMSALQPYDIRMQSLRQKVRSLSGGNQQKIVVARELSGRNAHFIVICQPTRGVDIGAIEHIHSAILKKSEEGAAIMLISSELEELCSLSDRIVVLNQGRFVLSQTGPSYDISKIGEAMVGQSSS